MNAVIVSDVVKNEIVQNEVVQSDFAQSVVTYSQNCQQAQAHNRKVLRDALFDLGVTEVVVEYSGGGDSGDVSDVLCQPESLLSSITSKQIEILDACCSFNGSAYVSLTKNYTSSLREALGAFAMGWLEIEHGGWEINDGGSGSMTIDVMTNRFTLNHSEYYQESKEYEYELE